MSTVSSESPKVQYSVQRELSDGSLNRISVRVPYFSKDDIHVYVNDIEINSTATEGSTYTWRWDGDYISITPNVASGEEVLVRRITPIDEAIHIFDGRSEFDDQSMDENFQQLIYIAQEYSEGSGIKDVFSDINMHGYKIRNVGWATDDDDIVTYGQYKVDAEGAKKARDEAKQHAQNALQYKQDTQGIATQAVADVATAKNNAIAEVQASVAPEVEKASEYATTAQTAANTAVSAKDRSELILTNVQTLEASASASASASAQSRDEAKAIKDELKAGLDTVQEIAEPIKIVANNINHVVTTSNNIYDVNIVGADLEGSTSSGAFQDYGDLDDPSGSTTVITGGNIKTVADNITHVRVDSENIESIKTVANAIDNLPTISATLGDAVQKAESARDSAQASATEATNQTNIAKTYATNASSSASSSATNASASANSANAAKLSEDNAALHKDSASASATEATKQAERAKNYADQMATGQVQSDWAETDPASKAFILHKPTLGKLSAKDSIAYSEITGTPPQPDLTPYAKTADVNTALNDKADQSDVDSTFQSVNTALGTKLNKSVFEGFVDYGDLG